MSIRLPKHQKPIFPAKCLGCAEEDPVSTVTIWTTNSNWWVILTILAIFWTKVAKATVPMCKRCAWRFRFRRLGYAAYLAGAIALSIWGCKHFLPKLPQLVGKGLMVVALAILMIPYITFETRMPPAIELYVDENEVTYQFRHERIAIEFSQLNGGYL